MPSSGEKKKRFKIHFDYRDRYVYIINGQDIDTNFGLSTCCKFDLLNKRWTKLPNTSLKCNTPGSVTTPDKQYLYIFGGYLKSQEFCQRLCLNESKCGLKAETWRHVSVKIDESTYNFKLANGIGTIALAQNPSKVLILGGYTNCSYILDLQRNSLETHDENAMEQKDYIYNNLHIYQGKILIPGYGNIVVYDHDTPEKNVCLSSKGTH